MRTITIPLSISRALILSLTLVSAVGAQTTAPTPNEQILRVIDENYVTIEHDGDIEGVLPQQIIFAVRDAGNVTLVPRGQAAVLDGDQGAIHHVGAGQFGVVVTGSPQQNIEECLIYDFGGPTIKGEGEQPGKIILGYDPTIGDFEISQGMISYTSAETGLTRITRVESPDGMGGLIGVDAETIKSLVVFPDETPVLVGPANRQVLIATDSSIVVDDETSDYVIGQNYNRTSSVMKTTSKDNVFYLNRKRAPDNINLTLDGGGGFDTYIVRADGGKTSLTLVIYEEGNGGVNQTKLILPDFDLDNATQTFSNGNLEILDSASGLLQTFFLVDTSGEPIEFMQRIPIVVIGVEEPN